MQHMHVLQKLVDFSSCKVRKKKSDKMSFLGGKEEEITISEQVVGQIAQTEIFGWDKCLSKINL